MTIPMWAAVFLSWIKPRRSDPAVRLDSDGLPRWERTVAEQRWQREEERRRRDELLRVIRYF